jgi:protein-disulfide isomerase
MYAAKVALSVYKISAEKFPLIHDDLMKIQHLNEDNIKELLKKHKIDYALVENEINSYDIKQLINHNFELAQHLGIRGAPSYIINGFLVPGLIDIEKFNLIIKQLQPDSVTKNIN